MVSPISTEKQSNQLKLKHSSVRIDGKAYKMSKGIFQVLTNRDDIKSNYIHLPVRIIHSSSKSQKDPVFWLAGGPGVSNMKQMPAGVLLKNHDFVLVGYRGVDGSVKLQSKTIKKAVTGINNSLLSEESLINLQNSTVKNILELRKAKIDLNFYTIIDVIDDFEDLRKRLGYDKINLLSASYGTRVALLYSYRYPKAIKRSVMAGVNPPGQFVWWPDKTEQIINQYDAILRRDYPAYNGISIKESIEESFVKMPFRWTFFRLDPGKIKAASFVMMYRKKSAVMVFDAYKKAATKGDFSGLYLMQLAYDFMVPRMFTWGDLFNKGASADSDPNTSYKELLIPPKNSIGAPLSLLIWGGGEKWPSVTLAPEYRKPRHSLTETLMIGGNLDISTPPEYAAKLLLPHMPNAIQIILEDMAHVDDLMYLQKDNFDALISGFFSKGIADTTEYQKDPVEFKTTISFAGIAKVFYPVVFILSLFK